MRALGLVLLLAGCHQGLDVCEGAPSTLEAAELRARTCGLGADAAALLRAAPYDKLVVEVASNAGLIPNMKALMHLQAVIADVCDKPGGVTVVLGDQDIPALGHPVTIDEVRSMEDAHRQRFSLGDTAAFFLLLAGDPSADDMGDLRVLGLAHRASSMVIFRRTIGLATGGLGQPNATDVESAVIAHELGHVLGLVNGSTPMVTPHQDTAHGAHDANAQCLMYYLNNSDVGVAGDLVVGGRIADFDAACRADLAAVRDAP